MRKIGFLLIVVVLLGGYAWFWVDQAEKAKTLVAFHLKEWGRVGEHGYQLQYEKLSVAGFPFAYEVKVSNPSYSSHQGQQPEVVVNGEITLGTNLIGTRYWVIRDGQVHLRHFSSTKEDDDFIITGRGKIELKVENHQYLTALSHPFKTFPKPLYTEPPSLDLIDHFIKEGELECQQFTFQEGNKAPIVKMEIGTLDWKRDSPDKTLEHFRVTGTLKNLEGLEEVERQLTNFVNGVTVPQDPFSYGKTNFTFDVEATFPSSLLHSGAYPDFKLISFKIHKMEISNDVRQSSLSLNLEIKAAEKERDIHFDVLSTTTSSIKDYEHTVYGFESYLKQQKNQLEHHEHVDQNIKKLLACCEDEFKNIVPKLYKLGELKIEIDLDAKITEKTPGKEELELKVRHFDVATTPYGVRSNGDIFWAGAFPKGDYKFDLLNEKMMVQDISDYYNGIQPLLSKLADKKPEEQSFPILTSEKIEKINIFLRGISDSPKEETKDLSITFHFPGDPNFKVGEKEIPELMESFQKLLDDLNKKG